MPSVRLTDKAAAQLVEARRWWYANRDKAPTAFDDDFNALVAMLKESPRLVGRPVYGDPRLRRVHLQRIRYYVYFESHEGDDPVDVLGLWHGSRGTRPEF